MRLPAKGELGMVSLCRPVSGLLFAFVCLATSNAHAADVSPESEYGRRIKVYQTIQPIGDTPFGEQVSMYTGDLTFRQTDVSLEGQGPTITLARSLATLMADTQVNEPHALGDWTLSIPRIETLVDAQDGWVVEGSADPLLRCSHFDRPAYSTLTDSGWHGIEMVTEAGDRQAMLKRAPQNTIAPVMNNQQGNAIAFPVVTAQNWQIGCLNQTSNGVPGEAFFAVSPNGTKYWFDHLAFDTANTTYENDPIGGLIRQRRKLATMYVSVIEDRFGNRVTYNYGTDDTLDSITSADGRRVDISWRSDYRLVDHITVQPLNAHPRTWRYEYDNFSSYTDTRGVVFKSARLTGVVLPLNNDGSSNGRWGFDLHGLGGGALPDSDLSKCNVRSKANAVATVASTITHPSGLQGTFYVGTTYHARNYVSSDCRYPPPPSEGEPWEDNPPLFSTASLRRKDLSGPGLVTKTWTYAYDTSPASTTSDTCAAAGTCGTTKWVNVTDPVGNLTTYVFSNRWDETEGKLLLTRTYQGLSTVLRDEAVEYAASNRGPWPSALGGGLDDPRANTAKSTTWTPQTKRTITQQGATFTWQATTFDVFSNPTTVYRFSSLNAAYLKTEVTEYFDSVALWVIGQVKKVTDVTDLNAPVILQETTYDNASALPVATYAFNQLKQTFTYYAEGVLHTVSDALNHTFTFNGYARGIAQRIDFPDGTTYVSAHVDDFSQLDSVRDPLGNTTGYGFDTMGRLATMTPPAGWNGSAFTFVPAGAEYGISTGHWRRSVVKGNAHSETIYDAEWRPLLTYDYDSGNVAGSARYVAHGYDVLGRENFVSMPSSVAPAWTTSGWYASGQPMPGMRTTYDALGRPLQVTTNSELAQDTLTTTYAYLTGFQTQVIDPRTATTTTTFQAFDTPSTKAPVYIEMPLGVTTQIVRDRFGKTLSLIRGGSGVVPVTRSYFYDAQQRLCRLHEPETGDTVTAYDTLDRVDWSATGATVTGTACGYEQVATASRVARQYDPMGRVVSIDYPAGTDDIALVYDAAGNVTTATSRGISAALDITWTYGARNSLGLPTSETLSVDGFNYKLQYAYDLQGSLKTLTYPDDRAVDFSPDALGRPTQAGGYVTNVAYFADGGTSYYKYGNGIEYFAQKNKRALPSNLTYSKAGNLLYSQDLAYDQNANLLSATDLSPSVPSRTKTMEYDLLNRLTKSTASALWGQEIYVYDALDNIQSITRDGVNNIFEYDSLNRLTRISNAANGQTLHTYGYDNKGNVTARDGTALTFDDANRLRAYAGKGNYRYDAWGRRVKRSDGAGNGQSYYAYSQAGVLLFEHELAANKLDDYVMLGSKLIAKVAADAPVPSLTAPTVSTNGSYSVNWTSITGATGYVLEESTNGGAWTQVQNSAATSWGASGKSQGTYAYRAQACFSYGCGTPSPAITVNVDLRPQAAPTITAPGYNPGPNFTVSWTSVATSTSYEIQESGSSLIWGPLYTGASLTFAVTGRAGGIYNYRGRACNANGCGPWGTTVTTNVELPPSAAPSLTAPTQSFSGSFGVSWTTIAGVTHYPLEQSFNGGAWTTVQDTAALAWSATSKPAGTYAFRARACNPAGCGGYSATVTVIVTYPPASAPTITTPATSVTGTYTVSWSSVASGTSYALQESLNGGAWTARYSGSATTYAASNLPDGTRAYRVQACNVAGCGAYSATATTQVEVTPVTPTLSVTQEVDDSVRPPYINWYVNWTASPGATRYDLQIQNGTATPGVVNVGNVTTYETEGRGTRTFWVRACKGISNCSAWSAPK
jgi:YD repeat-containing protein